VQLGTRCLELLGAPENGECHLVPLVIREKVSALIYADAGPSMPAPPRPGSGVEVSALEVLVRLAATWIELLALRKLAAAPAPPGAAMGSPASPTLAGGGGTSLRPGEPSSLPPPGVGQPVPAAAARPAALPLAPDSAVATAKVARSITPAPHAAPPAPSPAGGGDASPSGRSPLPPPAASAESGPEDELHRRARRFAKLLVDEIKLYNQAKVAEGKRNSDLCSRLKDDIDKSRATYDKRYASTAVASADYFTQELVRNLADNDPSLLGRDFPR